MAIPVEVGDKRFPVGGVTTVVTDGFVRPADTTQYTAADVVSNSAVALATRMLRFKDCARFDGGTGIIYSALLLDSIDAATNPNFDLVLFTTDKITLSADNAVSTVADDEIKYIVGAIQFDGTTAANISTPGGNLVVKAVGLGQAFKCDDNSRDLYGLVLDRGAYTPSSSERFDFKLSILQD